MIFSLKKIIKKIEHIKYKYSYLLLKVELVYLCLKNNLFLILMMKIISRMSSLILKKSDDMILFAHDHPVKLGETLKFGNSLGVVMSIFERNQLALLL